MFKHLSISLFASLALLGTAACDKGSSAPPPAEPPMTTGAATPGQSNAGDTFGVLRAIHSAEIERGELAQQKASDPRVKQFATKVVADHKTRMQKDNQIMSGLGISPTKNASSDAITSAAAQQSARLESLSGPAFDREYIDDQINYYRAVLDTFDRDLIPSARDAQIKSTLQDLRGRANEHLKEAQDIRVSLAAQ